MLSTLAYSVFTRRTTSSNAVRPASKMSPKPDLPKANSASEVSEMTWGGAGAGKGGAGKGGAGKGATTTGLGTSTVVTCTGAAKQDTTDVARDTVCNCKRVCANSGSAWLAVTFCMGMDTPG